MQPGTSIDPSDIKQLIAELRSTHQRVRELQHSVGELKTEQSLSAERLQLHQKLVKKLTRELVDERLAHIETKRAVADLRRSSSASSSGIAGDAGKAGSESGRSPLQDREASSNPWASPDKPVGTARSSMLSPPAGSKLMGFNFYSSDQPDDDPPSPSSSTQTLRGTLMGQFLPSSLLDSPQMTPTHAQAIASELSLLNEEKQPGNEETSSNSTDEVEDKDDNPKATEDRTSLESGSISSLRRSSVSAGDNQTDHHGADVTAMETKQAQSGMVGMSHAVGQLGERPSTSSVVSPVKLSMLSELFETISVEDLETVLVRFNGDETAAIDHLVQTHSSFNPSGSLVGKSPGTSSGQSAHGSLHKTYRASGGGSGSAGSSATGPGSSNWKTEICMYYMQGKCNKTRRTCSFAHGESDLARPIAGSSKVGYKTRLCPAYENGACPKSRRDCPLAHGVNDLREPGGGAQSTTAAAAAAMAAAIPGGVNNPALLPPPTPRLQSYKTELCYYYLKGNCNYTKEECRFAHGPSDLRTVESNTIAQMNAAAAAAAAFTAGAGVQSQGSTSASSPSVPSNFDKQLQWQHQYRPSQHLQQQQQLQQQQMSHLPPGYPSQMSPVQHGFLPSHQLQSHRSGQAFSYQQQQPPPPPPPQQSPHGGYQQQQQQQQSTLTPHAQPFRYLKSMDDLPRRGGRSGSGRRDSGSSWPGYDPGLPPPDF